MRTIIYTLICTAVLITASGCSEKEKSPATDKYNQAIELQEAERYKDALRLFHKAVQIDPNYEDAYLQIASIYDDHLEDKDRAVEWYQKYLDISQNENQNKLVKKWLEDAKISAEEIKSGAKGDMAKLSPQVRDIIKKHVSLERAKIKQEFKQKEKILNKKYKNEAKALKEQLAEIKSQNTDLKDKIENLTIDLNAAQKNSARNNVRDKLVGLLSSASKSKTQKNTIPSKKYIELESKLEETKVQLSQERAKGAKLERQILSLDENIRKLKQLGKTSNKTAAYQKQIEELQDRNIKLAEKVKLLENAAAMAKQIKEDNSEAGKDDEIQQLQNRIAEMDGEKTKILDEKREVEQSLAKLQKQLDEIGTGESDISFSQKTVEENKKLRQQIARITSEFNEVSKKQNSAEQKVQELQDKIDELKNMPQKIKTVTVNANFKDLSEEITSMQKTIQKQKETISRKEAQLLELITQNLNFQKALENEQTGDIVKELNELLVKKNKHIQELAKKLSEATMSQGGSMVEAKHIQALSDQISDLREQVSSLKRQLSEKSESINNNTELYQKYKTAYDELNLKFNDVNSKNKLLESDVNALKKQLFAANKAIKKYTKK